MYIHNCDQCRFEDLQYVTDIQIGNKIYEDFYIEVYTCKPNGNIKLRYGNKPDDVIITDRDQLESVLLQCNVINAKEEAKEWLEDIDMNPLTADYWAIVQSWGDSYEDYGTDTLDFIFTDRDEAEKYRLYLANKRGNPIPCGWVEGCMECRREHYHDCMNKYDDNERTRYYVIPMIDANKVDLYKEEE